MRNIKDLVSTHPIHFLDFTFIGVLKEQHLNVLQVMEDLLSDICASSLVLHLPAITIFNGLEKQKVREQVMMTCDDLETTLSEVGLSASYALVDLEKSNPYPETQEGLSSVKAKGLAITVTVNEDFKNAA
ncbi:hypothetical protein [Curvivirga sp.]|uniref:hypothetical protein n=1 Tax=Curvivirga sp. TaxID=2856848 RepID=UPI003B5AB10B